MSEKLWGGRFTEKASSLMERIGESISFDKRLYRQDLLQNIVHVTNLNRIGVLSNEELDKVRFGFKTILQEIESGQFIYQIELEDIHMHIESRLTELIGDIGKKIHTGRSRNDQVAQDVRLFIHDETLHTLKLLYQLLSTIYKRAVESTDIVMPGYTHLQVAQPILVSHYLLSHFWAIYRVGQLYLYGLNSNDVLVLGSGALAGVNYPTQRDYMANVLKLNGVSYNSIDSVASRDHILNFLYTSTSFMLQASRICEEIILFTSQEFRFLSLPDSLTTGSSIMPQKKNPDIAELIRGKSARVIGNLNHLMIMLKGLPLAYNRDLQEDKIALFDSVDQVQISIEGLSEMIDKMQFLPENMENSLKNGFATATDLADFLVNEKKIPFRDAHELVGQIVAECVRQNKTLFDLDIESRRAISEHFATNAYWDAISLRNSCNKKNTIGGTSKQRQKEQLEQALKNLVQFKNTIDELDKNSVQIEDFLK